MRSRSLAARATNLLGRIAVGALAIVGVACAGLWVAHEFGAVQPLVVASGSMTPAIKTGDLILAVPTPASEVAVGEVATLPSALEETLVTHRVTAVTATDDGYTFEMKGDANDTVDPETYAVDADASVLQPALVIPGAGRYVTALRQPQATLPILGGLLLFAALALFPVRSATHARATSQDAADPTHSPLPPEPVASNPTLR
ncbi:signal peptidase I [Microbacterium sp. Sa4CUA7]|uniref:Signal peptidase I n=1 Tax=Microbacterium pullorum TaxID=2762236 RepID=A0ABR8S2B5_9MICO|nr:signal peptidase I [Microbacterium pullorum]MBD7957621.1 signal peptidase I [Microbacterium pullorum]